MGETRCPASTSSSPASPRITRTAAGGSGTAEGRFIALPSTRANSALVAALGATTLTGPSISGRSIRKTIAATTSRRLIHDITCLPVPYRPPMKNVNGVASGGSAPPSIDRTTPILSSETALPAWAAGSVAASQSSISSWR